MKKLLLFAFFVIAFTMNAISGIIVLEGKYQDKNLFIQNGYAGNGIGFCTYEVTINGQMSTDEVNSTAFEIDFSALQIKPGTAVIVEIKHKDDCSPKVLNPEALKPKATFEVVNINIDKNGLLHWSTKNEMGSLPYIVEQYRWNKWIKVGEVKGNGSLEKNSYVFQTTAHSGENKYRVKQVGYGGISKVSSNVTYISNVEQPTYTINTNTSGIDFSRETMYEVYDVYGDLVKRGYNKSIDISNLQRGSYYLCYDNIMSDFRKK